MSLPTLLIKGSLRAPNGDPKLQEDLNRFVPIDYIINWFKDRQNLTGVENRFLVLQAETASGKSTTFPAELYRHMVWPLGKGVPGIICTQPRTLTAIRNVPQIVYESGPDYPTFLKVGENIGWSTKASKLRPKQMGLLSATVGTLAMQLRSFDDNRIMRMYKYILIDETHERDLQIDMTLYMLKNFLLRNATNPNCPFVVLMSATFDPDKFIRYYGGTRLGNYIWCTGRTFNIIEHWDWNQDRTVNDYPRAASSVTEMIVRGAEADPVDRADILIFMPGKAEIKETAEWLEKVNEKLVGENKSPFAILQVDAEAQRANSYDYRMLDVPTQDQTVVVSEKNYKPVRRVIISTNAAETGLTLRNLKYVIDAGFNREIEFNPVHGIRGLVTKPAPKSRIKQRRGRAGRKFEGEFYPLYPKYIFERLPDLQYPQILLEDVSVIAMDMIREQLRAKRLLGDKSPELNTNDIDMVDPPTPDSLALALERLYALGFVAPYSPAYTEIREDLIKEPYSSAVKFGLTKLGIVGAAISMIAPESLRMIFGAYNWGCSTIDMITVAAYLSLEAKGFAADKTGVNWVAVYKSGAPGYLDVDKMLYKLRLLIADEFIDGLFLFNAFKYIIGKAEPRSIAKNLRAWCNTANVSYSAALTFIRTRDDLIEQFLAAGFDIFSGEDHALLSTSIDEFMDTITRIKYCIYEGYRLNLITRKGTDYYTSTGVKVNTPKLFRDDEKKRAEVAEYGYVVNALPTMFMYRGLSLKYNRNTFMYEVVVDRVSSLDGFVHDDPYFLV